MHILVAKVLLFVLYGSLYPCFSRWLVAQPMPLTTAKLPTDVAVELVGCPVGRAVGCRVGRRVGRLVTARVGCLCFLKIPKALALTNMHNTSMSFIAVAADMCPRGRPACQC